MNEKDGSCCADIDTFIAEESARIASEAKALEVNPPDFQGPIEVLNEFRNAAAKLAGQRELLEKLGQVAGVAKPQ